LALATSMAGRARCRMARSDLRLLVVEDDPDMRCLLGEILRPLGAVVAVPDVYQALNAVRYQSFDAIVLDLVFPGASGFDLMERLRTLQTPTPVVVVTGLVSDVALRRARALGAHAFVTKPFDVDLLLRTVAGAADARRHFPPLVEWGAERGEHIGDGARPVRFRTDVDHVGSSRPARPLSGGQPRRSRARARQPNGAAGPGHRPRDHADSDAPGPGVMGTP
jgi:CheY-like chemotaxis protein